MNQQAFALLQAIAAAGVVAYNTTLPYFPITDLDLAGLLKLDPPYSNNRYPDGFTMALSDFAKEFAPYLPPDYDSYRRTHLAAVEARSRAQRTSLRLRAAELTEHSLPYLNSLSSPHGVTVGLQLFEHGKPFLSSLKSKAAKVWNAQIVTQLPTDCSSEHQDLSILNEIRSTGIAFACDVDRAGKALADLLPTADPGSPRGQHLALARNVLDDIEAVLAASRRHIAVTKEPLHFVVHQDAQVLA